MERHIFDDFILFRADDAVLWEGVQDVRFTLDSLVDPLEKAHHWVIIKFFDQ